MIRPGLSRTRPLLASLGSPERSFDDALSLVAAVSGRGALAPTYFEALTVSAFELFRLARVEVAVVEVGIGGRLDATNVLESEVSAVTNVCAHHMETLGPTFADVAREKHPNQARRRDPARAPAGRRPRRPLRQDGEAPEGRDREAP